MYPGEDNGRLLDGDPHGLLEGYSNYLVNMGKAKETVSAYRRKIFNICKEDGLIDYEVDLPVDCAGLTAGTDLDDLVVAIKGSDKNKKEKGRAAAALAHLGVMLKKLANAPQLAPPPPSARPPCGKGTVGCPHRRGGAGHSAECYGQAGARYNAAKRRRRRADNRTAAEEARWRARRAAQARAYRARKKIRERRAARDEAQPARHPSKREKERKTSGTPALTTSG